MKKRNLLIIGLLALVSMVGCLLFGVFTFSDIYEVLVIGSGSAVTYATAISGGVTTTNMETAQSKVLADELQRNILMLKPDNNPLDTLIRATKKAIPKHAWKVEWPYMSTRPLTDVVATANGGAEATSDTLICTNASMWLVDDIVRFVGVTGTSNSQDFVGQITAKSGTTLTIQAINGTTSDGYVPVCAAATVMVRIGSAKHETAASTTVFNNSPETAYNYMQLHMAQIKESVIYGKHKKDIAYDYALQKANAMYDFRATMELASVLGQRGKFTDETSSTEKYTSHGVWNYIEQTLNYGKSGDANTFFDSNWIDICKTLFEGNNGSDKRYLFVDSELMARISKLDTVQKQRDAKATEVVHGVTFNKVVTNFGELYIKRHRMLDEAGMSGYGMALDLANVQKYVFEPLQTKKLDYDTPGIERVHATRFLESFCLGLTNLDTHAIIAPYGS